MNLQHERNLEAKRKIQFKQRLKTAANNYRITPETSARNTIARLSARIKDQNLARSLYLDLCNQERARHPLAYARTEAEFAFEKLLKGESRARLKTSFPIGPFVVDAFTNRWGHRKPGKARGHTHLGIVFEIDGPIHEQTEKKAMDRYRDELFEMMGLTVWRITNAQVRRRRYTPSRQTLKNDFAILSSPSRKRILKKIYLVTLLFLATDEQLCAVLPKAVGRPVRKTK